MFERYPWHESVWQQLLARIKSGMLPHALLLTGGSGIGKRDFAVQLAQLLLCESFQAGPGAGENPLPCGRCQACALNKAMTHPDFKLVEPESEGKIISIDQIRDLGAFFGLKSHYGLGQIAVVYPAEKMNKFAANSLLKTLEEPTPSSLILLVTSQPSALLPTIRSRCQLVAFEQPPLDATVSWLKSNTSSDEANIKTMLHLASGGPLQALNYLKNNTRELMEGLLESFVTLTLGKADPVTVAKAWAETDVAALIKWLILWTSHMIRLKYGVQKPDNDPVGESSLKNLAATVDLVALFRFMDKLTETRRLLDSQANVQLLLEDLLITWLQLNPGNPLSATNRA